MWREGGFFNSSVLRYDAVLSVTLQSDGENARQQELWEIKIGCTHSMRTMKLAYITVH